MSRLILVFVLALAFAAGPSTAFAYLDPGSGSMIVQAVIGAVAVGGLTLKVYWRNLWSFFGMSSDKPINSEKSDTSPSKS